MNINAIEELNRVLEEIDAKIKHLESSPNRAFVLVEYDTLNLFHWFNECFKQFWDEFDHSSSQLLFFHNITKRHSELIDKYVALFREQIDYLESVIDFKYKSVKELPPVIFAENNRTDVIGYYMENFKDETGENGKPLYYIDLDSEHNYEMINGKEVPIDFYTFQSDELNGKHYTGLIGMYHCLNSLYPLVHTVCSYPNALQLGYTPSEEEIIYSLELDLRKYAQQIGKNIDRELRRKFLELKRTNNESLPTDIWGLVMKLEDEAFRLAISAELVGKRDELFDHIDEDQRKIWTDNYPLLQKIKETSIDDELFDVRLSVETHNLLSVLKADNLELFYELVLRRNIIHREMYPEKLKDKYEEWVYPSEERQFGKNEETITDDTNQSDKEELNYVAPKIALQKLLTDDWFDTVSVDKQKYNTIWRHTLVEALMKSDYGTDIANDWTDESKRLQVKFAIIGVLKDAGVINSSYNALASKFNISNIDTATLAKYMGYCKKKSYYKWLKNYVNPEIIE